MATPDYEKSSKLTSWIIIWLLVAEIVIGSSTLGFMIWSHTKSVKPINK